MMSCHWSFCYDAWFSAFAFFAFNDMSAPFRDKR
ncbi:hypothetical protein CKAH01_17365 [Colletotrichum kahawae]|uniref:Uncharacterized protein n=1 Tax=Colletotrichum kahawae TaxID=34407 RepID=A0AAD9YAH0_COLKA|nr:hypothetical protein CKAH01_17365 [Colletotrichum kahawae]